MTERVWMPQVLQGYACGRTMACCQAPWRANLREGEGLRIEQHLRTGAPALLPRWQAAVTTRAGLAIVHQPGGTCTLLDPAEKACALQASAGLDALPGSCRNFPRSVVRTPQGLEVAFTLACPTAAGLVVQRPQPFAWHQRPSDGWPYSPVRTVGSRLRASRARDVTFAEAQALRQAWWQRLVAAQLAETVDDLARTVDDLAGQPLEPQARGQGDDLAWRAPLDPRQVRTVTAVLLGLPDGAPYRGHERALWAGWLAPLAEQPELHDTTSIWTTLAGLAIQHAAVHDGLPLAEGLQRAARQVRQAVRVWATLQVVPGLAPQQRARDALVVAAHLAQH